MNYRGIIEWDGYIYLKEIKETDELEDCALRIQISRCKVSDKIVPAIKANDVVIEANPIEIDEDLSIIQFEFDSYVSYSVINESYAPFDDYEKYDGGMLRIYTKSRYLDFIKIRTFAEDIVPEQQFVHYQIPCLDHIIDVISYKQPKVSEIKRV